MVVAASNRHEMTRSGLARRIGSVVRNSYRRYRTVIGVIISVFVVKSRALYLSWEKKRRVKEEEKDEEER